MKYKSIKMIIRISLVLFFVLSSSQWILVTAETVKDQTVEFKPLEIKSQKNFFLKFKGIYFQPSTTTFKDIYKNRWMGEGEFAVRIFKFIELWLGGNYYSGRGKLPFTEEDTSITLIGIGGGLKFRAEIGAFSPYLGLGPLVYLYKERNSIGTAKGNDFGYIGQVGFYLFLFRAVFLDFSISYTKCKVQPQRIKTDLGGLYGGIGLGFAF